MKAIEAAAKRELGKYLKARHVLVHIWASEGWTAQEIYSILAINRDDIIRLMESAPPASPDLSKRFR